MKTYAKTPAQIHMLSCLDFSGYNLTPEPLTEEEKLHAAMKIARQEVGHIEIQEGITAMLEYWFSGLCSVCSLPYMNHEILEYAVKWGSLPRNYTEAQADKILENYWHYMASQFRLMIGRLPQ